MIYVQLLKQFGVPVEDDGRRLKVARTVGGKGSSASVNGCSIKVSFEIFALLAGRVLFVGARRDAADCRCQLLYATCSR